MEESTESDILGAIRRLHAVKPGHQVIEELNEFLCSIHNLASQDAGLSKVLQFRIQGKKGTGSKPYMSKVLEYTGPDTATTDLLTERRNGWENNPATFYIVQSYSIAVDNLDPQAQIVGSCLFLNGTSAHARIVRRCYCIVLEKVRQKRGCRSAEEIACSLHEARLFLPRTLQELVDFTNLLIDAGSRYLCLEEELGVGSIFLLGQDIPDNVWEKRLPKSGEMRKEVIDHLKQQELPQKAQQYKTLRILVVDHALACYGLADAVSTPNWGADILSRMDFPGSHPFPNETGPSMTDWMVFGSS